MYEQLGNETIGERLKQVVTKMIFRGKPLRRISMSINPHVEFKQIIDILDDLELPQADVKSREIRYAVLEMINNSLRAHRDFKINEPFTVTFEFVNPELNIVIEDRGPGFDTRSLPYSLNDDPDKLDFKSDSFREYSRKHDFKRFGMGLCLVRKTFSSFELSFLNSNGQLVEWEKGKICGTRIKVGVGGPVNERT